MTANPISGTSREAKNLGIELIFSCPNPECHHLFIAQYKASNQIVPNSRKFQFVASAPCSIVKREWGETIVSASASFIAIYDQAFAAEQHGLDKICGMGYRKALEFLIKDYLIVKHPESEADIRAKFLGICIKDYISDPRLLSASKAATWLGNDETHYERKWETKDLSDLKALIELSVHWIAMEKLSEHFATEMTPDIDVTSALAGGVTLAN